MTQAMRITFAAALVAALSLAATAGAAEPKRVMAFGDSITWGWKPVAEGVPSDRYPASVRWPGAMQSALGSDCTVVEEGFNARTTDVADPTLPQITGAGLVVRVRNSPSPISYGSSPRFRGLAHG